ncbi:hypothetical protein DRN43_00605 [Thermococci archaeon]|nr:MAG: hypothetical protein DRN43_00605 [Thermococci archaeon]
MSEVEFILKKADEYWLGVKSVLQTVSDMRADFNQNFYCAESWQNPIPDLKIYDWALSVRSNLISFVTSRVLQLMDIKNLHVDMEEISALLNDEVGENNFDAKTLFEILKEKYLDNAEEIAFSQILDKARRCVNDRVYDDEIEGWRPVKPEEIVKNSTLILHRYADEYYPQAFIDDFSAVEKLIRIIAGKETAIKAKIPFTSTVLFKEMVFDRNIWGKHQGNLSTYPIMSVTVHKNGKVKVRLTSSTIAKKVAEKLLEG